MMYFYESDHIQTSSIFDFSDFFHNGCRSSRQMFTFHYGLSISYFSNQIFDLLFSQAILLPPVAVFLARDKVCSCMVALNILLTLLGWVPGKCSDHAIDLILSLILKVLFMHLLLFVVVHVINKLINQISLCHILFKLNSCHIFPLSNLFFFFSFFNDNKLVVR